MARFNRREREQMEMIQGVAASVESMAAMADGELQDALKRLRVIRVDAARIHRLATMVLRKPGDAA